MPSGLSLRIVSESANMLGRTMGELGEKRVLCHLWGFPDSGQSALLFAVRREGWGGAESRIEIYI